MGVECRETSHLTGVALALRPVYSAQTNVDIPWASASIRSCSMSTSARSTVRSVMPISITIQISVQLPIPIPVPLSLAWNMPHIKYTTIPSSSPSAPK